MGDGERVTCHVTALFSYHSLSMPTLPKTIGPYEVDREIGRGGMGIVYLARDTRLGRDVAIKALPDELAADPDRLARFEREARLLATLHHSNIAVVYGLEEVDGVRYLVMEHVAGEDLDTRLERGPLAVDDVVMLARQMAEALEAAHSRGIIHRDLKPGNVKLTREGRFKVLDFGLAKTAEDGPPDRSISDSPTVTTPHSPTVPGVILGTAGYMSPEQARGKPVDKRTDIWSYGCVLYEALTGEPPFTGETVTDCIAATIRGEPKWDALPPDTPPRLRLVMRRCMTKDPDHRLHDIADARVEIEELAGDPSLDVTAPAAAPARFRTSRLVAAVLGLLLLASLVGHVITLGRDGTPAGAPRTDYVAIAAPTGEAIWFWGGTVAAISPDGRQVAFASTESPALNKLVQIPGSPARMIVRSLGDREPRVLPGSEGAYCPFFSPDGSQLAFFGPSGLVTVPTGGGVPVLLAPATNGVGGSWGRDGTIVYAPHWSGGLWRIAAGGGEPRQVTTLDPTNNEAGHRWPHLLPDGKSVLLTIKTGDLLTFNDAQIAVASLETGEHRVLFTGGMGARYVPTGHILFCRGTTIYAAPFDLDTLELTGPSAPVLDRVEADDWDGSAHFSVADNGTLLYLPDGPINDVGRELDLVWVDRDGTETPAMNERRGYLAPVLSPDGTLVAAGVSATNGNLWIGSLASGTFSRLTFGSGNSLGPVWTPDGTRIAFLSDRDSSGDIFWMPADGSGAAELIYRSPTGSVAPSSWSPDGKTLLFVEVRPETGADLWQLRIGGEGEPEPLVATRFDEGEAVFAPDGKWFAYTSTESGRPEVYLRPSLRPGGKVRISYGGGHAPRWSRDGSELFYWSPDGMVATAIRTEPAPQVGASEVLFDGSDYDLGSFDVAADGRFLLVKGEAVDTDLRHLTLVLNWFEELKRLAPVE